MNINKTIAAILIAGTMLLSGCSNNIPIEENSSYSAISDPMKEPTSSGGHKSGVIGSYSAGLSNDDVDFSTDTLVLTPSVIGDENPTMLGMMAFIDGIPRKYTLNDSTDGRTLSVVETTPSEVKYTLELDTEFDTELDTHYATMLYILDPEFFPENGIGFGMYHSGSHWYSIPINTAGKELPKLNFKALKTESIPFTQKQIEQYRIPTGEESGARTGFELYQEWRVNKITLDNDNSPEMTFAGYTTAPNDCGNYRVTFYKNHELCTFNSGYDCLDLTLEGSKIVEEKIVFDEELHAGDFVYCVAIPLFKDGFTEKSDSTMVVDKNNEPSQTPQPSSSSTAIESSEPSQAVQPTSSEKINAINYRPLFSNSDIIYFIDNRDRSELSIISSENGTDIQNTLLLKNREDVFVRSYYLHGDCVSILFEDNGKYIAKLYDKNLKEIKSADLSELQIMPEGLSPDGMVDFNNNRIVYSVNAGNNAALFSCDWNLKNKQKLMELPCKEYPLASYFWGISLSNDFVAFSAYGNEGDVKAGFYGVCDFNGNYKINRKDGITTPQTNDTMAMWQDNHTDINSGKMPSGKLEIYKKDKFTTLKTEDVLESHRAFLCNSGSIITATESGNWCLRKYSDGKVSKKVGLREDMFIASAVEFNSKIYALVSEYSPAAGKSTSNCLVWEG